MKDMLSSIGVKVYYFGTLTKEGNPRHPVKRQEKWDLSKKEYKIISVLLPLKWREQVSDTFVI